MTMPLVEAFRTRTSSVLSSMRSRFKEKLNKRGKVIRPGRVVPVELEEFRLWVLYHLGGRADGCGQCEYCRQPVDAMNFATDHKTPVKRGGGLGIDNFGFCCDACNRVKGILTAEEFVQLLDLLRRWDVVAAKDVRERLKMGEGFRRMRFFDRKKAASPPARAAEQLPLEEPF